MPSRDSCKPCKRCEPCVHHRIQPELLWQAMVNPLHMAAICGTPPSDDMARRLVALVLDGVRASSAH